MLLRDIYEQKHYAFVKTPMTWEESIRECCKPLEADGTVNPEYADDIIECVEKYGPYIVIVPNVAMPHSTARIGSNGKTAIGFMHSDVPVNFEDGDDEKQVKTFFTLSATDQEAHLKNMQMLVQVLMNEEVLERLKNIQSPEELLEIDELISE